MPALDADLQKWVPLFWPIMILDFVLGFLLKLINGDDPNLTNSTKLQSWEAGKATERHGAPRRSPKATKAFVATYNGNTTVYEMIQKAVEKFGPRTAMQHYEFKELKKLKETDRFPSKVFGDDLVRVSYNELGDNLVAFGKGLRELGMEPQPESTKTDFDNSKGKFALVIFEDTCKEWTTALQGAMSQSMVVGTCYATLGEDAVISAVNEMEATALLVNWKKAESFYKRAKEMPSLATIIASTNELGENGTVWKPDDGEKSDNKVRVVSYDEIIETGKKSDKDVTPPKPEDVAVIMYTSGSTGKPKGVVMKHSHLVAGIAGMVLNVHLREGEEVFVSYLPLAHILALQVENVLLSVGATLCYSDARQLSHVMPKVQPTIFAGVPKVWELLQGGLTKKINSGPPALKIVFNILLNWKTSQLAAGYDTPVSNLFFGVVAKKVFGREKIEFGVTGGGPMSASLQLFCRAVFNCPIIQGYALTETCVGGCFQSTKDQRPGVVGPPVPCVEAVLQSEPEFRDTAGLPYLHTDTKGSKGEAVLGRGEICLRGPSISSGYYKLPGKTKEEFDEEGFFHTGDIGQFTADGVLQIVDRKKNLVKLKGGEYVAIEAMETAFAVSHFATALMVIANGDMDSPLAVVCANPEHLEAWAKGAGVGFTNVHDLAHKPEARQEVVKSFVAAGKEAGLGKLELRIKDVALITDTVWAPGHGMTASMKLDRHKVMEIHDKEIQDMYQRNGVKITH